MRLKDHPWKNHMEWNVEAERMEWKWNALSSDEHITWWKWNNHGKTMKSSSDRECHPLPHEIEAGL